MNDDLYRDAERALHALAEEYASYHHAIDQEIAARRAADRLGAIQLRQALDGEPIDSAEDVRCRARLLRTIASAQESLRRVKRWHHEAVVAIADYLRALEEK